MQLHFCANSSKFYFFSEKNWWNISKKIINFKEHQYTSRLLFWQDQFLTITAFQLWHFPRNYKIKFSEWRACLLAVHAAWQQIFGGMGGVGRSACGYVLVFGWLCAHMPVCVKASVFSYAQTCACMSCMCVQVTSYQYICWCECTTVLFWKSQFTHTKVFMSLSNINEICRIGLLV